MNKRVEHSKKRVILEKIVNTPRGKYNLSFSPSEDSIFSVSYNLKIKHLNVGFLEKLFGGNVRIIKDACHNFEGVYPEYGKIIFNNTLPKEIGYNFTNGQFYVHYFQDSIFPDKETSIPQMPRTKHFPIPETTYDKIKKFFVREVK